MTKLVHINSVVLLRSHQYEARFRLVETEKSNPGAGMISIVSPLGQAILGHGENESVVIDTPQGRRISYRIIRID